MTINPADSEIFGALFGTEEMRRVFSDRERLQSMLDVEAALARAQARLGIIPAVAAQAITEAASVDRIKLDELGTGTQMIGQPVAALVKALGQAAGSEAARYVHWGATTQDIVDTALVLQLRKGLDLVETAVRELSAALSEKAKIHRADLMAGRTYLQHGLPITFGYKCAVWLAPFLTHLDRLRELKPRVLVVQLAGAVGTLASLKAEGRAVTVGLAKDLGLAEPEAPWHVNRDGLAEVACFLGLVSGSAAKIATDVILLAQTEVAEVSEPHQAGRGGSSTMPQKRNPIASAHILACARGVHALVPIMLGALAQDHERATGPWQSEALALPQIFVLTSGALAHAISLAKGLVVDPERMRRNLDATGGLIMSEAVMIALAEKIGRSAAHDLVEHACDKAIQSRRPLADVLLEEPALAAHFDRPALLRLLQPEQYLGEALEIVDRVLARARTITVRAPGLSSRPHP